MDSGFHQFVAQTVLYKVAYKTPHAEIVTGFVHIGYKLISDTIQVDCTKDQI